MLSPLISLLLQSRVATRITRVNIYECTDIRGYTTSPVSSWYVAFDHLRYEIQATTSVSVNFHMKAVNV